MGEKVKIAGVQIDPKILEKEVNLSRCLELIELTAREGARLIVFPECTLTGYSFTSLEEALPVFEPVPGPSTEEIMAACRRLNVYVIVCLLEKDGDKYYNTAALLGPRGLVGKHRKLHLPYLGIDRFLNHGDLPLTVHDTEVPPGLRSAKYSPSISHRPELLRTMFTASPSTASARSEEPSSPAAVR